MAKSNGQKGKGHSFRKAPTKHKSKTVRAAAKWGLKTGANREKRKHQ